MRLIKRYTKKILIQIEFFLKSIIVSVELIKIKPYPVLY